MAELHTKLRLEIVIERPALRRAERLLEEAGVTGWTVTPAIAGYGNGTRWSRGTDISSSTDMVVIMSIGDEDVLLPVLSQLHTLVSRYVGVVNLGEVKVLREDNF